MQVTFCLPDQMNVYYVGGPLMRDGPAMYILIGTLSPIDELCGETGRGTYNKVSDWVNWINKELDQLGEKVPSHHECLHIGDKNGGRLFGNLDDEGGVDGLDNQEKDVGDIAGNQGQTGGDCVGHQDQDAEDGLGNQYQD